MKINKRRENDGWAIVIINFFLAQREMCLFIILRLAFRFYSALLSCSRMSESIKASRWIRYLTAHLICFGEFDKTSLQRCEAAAARTNRQSSRYDVFEWMQSEEEKVKIIVMSCTATAEHISNDERQTHFELVESGTSSCDSLKFRRFFNFSFYVRKDQK